MGSLCVCARARVRAKPTLLPCWADEDRLLGGKTLWEKERFNRSQNATLCTKLQSAQSRPRLEIESLAARNRHTPSLRHHLASLAPPGCSQPAPSTRFGQSKSRRNTQNAKQRMRATAVGSEQGEGSSRSASSALRRQARVSYLSNLPRG